MEERKEETVAMVIDDNCVNRLVLRGLLAKIGGIEILEGRNGLEAVELVEREANNQRRSTVVFMDIEMPRMDGIQATSKIRQILDNRFPVIIVAVTALSAEEARSKCLKAGMDGFLPKPVQPSQIEYFLSMVAHQSGVYRN